MAEAKVHKMEAPNKAEPTPQEKKAKCLRAAGHSLREISEMLKIPRSKVEVFVSGTIVTPRLPASNSDKEGKLLVDKEAKARVKEANAKARPGQREANARAGKGAKGK